MMLPFLAIVGALAWPLGALLMLAYISETREIQSWQIGDRTATRKVALLIAVFWWAVLIFTVSRDVVYIVRDRMHRREARALLARIGGESDK